MYVADEDVAKSLSGVGAFHFDECEGYISVEERVMSKVDPLLAALTQELLDLIPAVGEKGRLLGGLSRGYRSRGLRCRLITLGLERCTTVSAVQRPGIILPTGETFLLPSVGGASPWGRANLR